MPAETADKKAELRPEIDISIRGADYVAPEKRGFLRLEQRAKDVELGRHYNTEGPGNEYLDQYLSVVKGKGFKGEDGKPAKRSLASRLARTVGSWNPLIQTRSEDELSAMQEKARKGWVAEKYLEIVLASMATVAFASAIHKAAERQLQSQRNTAHSVDKDVPQKDKDTARVEAARLHTPWALTITYTVLGAALIGAGLFSIVGIGLGFVAVAGLPAAAITAAIPVGVALVYLGYGALTQAVRPQTLTELATAGVHKFDKVVSDNNMLKWKDILSKTFRFNKRGELADRYIAKGKLGSFAVKLAYAVKAVFQPGTLLRAIYLTADRLLETFAGVKKAKELLKEGSKSVKDKDGNETKEAFTDKEINALKGKAHSNWIGRKTLKTVVTAPLMALEGALKPIDLTVEFLFDYLSRGAAKVDNRLFKGKGETGAADGKAADAGKKSSGDAWYNKLGRRIGFGKGKAAKTEAAKTEAAKAEAGEGAAPLPPPGGKGPQGGPSAQGPGAPGTGL